MGKVSKAIDKIIEGISPSWGRSRAVNRLQITAAREGLSVYGAAERSRITADWKTNNYSANTAILTDLKSINARARSAVRDDWLAASIVNSFRRHIVGTGLTSRSTARNPKDGSNLESHNQRLDILFSHWATNPQLCDLEGCKTFVEIQGQLASEYATVGQAFLMLSYIPNADFVGLKLQVIEVEQLCDTVTSYTDPETKVTREIRNGIEVDEYSRPVAYWVFRKQHPLDTGTWKSDPERIPADRILHFYRQDRPQQIHAVSKLAPVLKKLRSLQLYEEYMLIRSQFEACIGGFISSGANRGGVSDNWISANTPTTNAKGQREINVEPGIVHRLNPGENFDSFIPSSPGQYYDAFVRAQIHHISAGVGLDYATTSRDFSQTTYGGQRQGMIERDKETDPIQLLLIDQICRPVRNEFVKLVALEERLEMPLYFQDKEWEIAYQAADWQPPPKPWLDPRNEAQAIALMLDYGLTTRGKELNILGEGWRNSFRQSADERNFAKDLGIEFPDMVGDYKGTIQEDPSTQQQSKPRRKRQPKIEIEGEKNANANT